MHPMARPVHNKTGAARQATQLEATDFGIYSGVFDSLPWMMVESNYSCRAVVWFNANAAAVKDVQKSGFASL